MPGKQVSQSTFDAIVREAMSDFGMSAQEAVVDAREQLSMAGVTDFSNLIDPISSEQGSNLSEFASISSKLRAEIAGNNIETEAIVALIDHLALADEKSIAVAGGNEAVEAVAEALNISKLTTSTEEGSITFACCKAIAALCSKNEANRSRFINLKNPDAVALLVSLMQPLSESLQEFPEFVKAYFAAVASIQRRCESVKQRFSSDQSPDRMLQIMEWGVRGVAAGLPRIEHLRQVCRVIRQWLSADDASVTVAETFVRARLLAGSNIVTESGLRPLNTEKTLIDILRDMITEGENANDMNRFVLHRECVCVARSLAVSDEICKQLVDKGVANLAFQLTRERKKDPAVVCVCLGLLRSLAGRDACKTMVFDGMSDIYDAVELHFRKRAEIAEVFCGLAAALCLRRGDIGKDFVQGRAMKIILESMETYDKMATLLKNGCLTIRNAASKDETARLGLIADDRAERLIRTAWKSFPGLCDEVAYSALEELDVLDEAEMRRDERYTMPDGFYQRAIVRKGRV